MSQAHFDLDTEALESRLSEVPEHASPQQAAEILFPEDERAQYEYQVYARDLDATFAQLKADAQARGEIGTEALPAWLAAIMPAVMLCVKGSVEGVVITEVVHLALSGQWNSAIGRLEAAVGGCLSRFMPKSWAQAVQRQVTAAVIWIIMKFPK